MTYALPVAIRSRVKGLLAAPVMRFWTAYYAGQATCLNYHRLTLARPDPQRFEPQLTLAVHRDLFAEHIAYLAREQRCLDIGTAVNLLRSGRLYRNSVIVSFDDGYRDNLELALPILEKHNVPAVIYISTGLLDGSITPWWYEINDILAELAELDLQWRKCHYHWGLNSLSAKQAASEVLTGLMKAEDLRGQAELLGRLREGCPRVFIYRDQMLSWEQLRELDRHPLITIGSHSNTHAVLSRLSATELAAELRDSKLYLEERLGHEVQHFAYPFGERAQAGAREYQAAAEVGYLAAVLTRNGHWQVEHAQHLLALPRIVIDYYDNMGSFKWKLSGLEALLHHDARRFISD